MEGNTDKDSTACCTVASAYASEEDARKAARSLVDLRLIASGQIRRIRSVYR